MKTIGDSCRVCRIIKYMNRKRCFVSCRTTTDDMHIVHSHIKYTFDCSNWDAIRIDWNQVY